MHVLGRTTLALSLALAVLVPAQLAAAEGPDRSGKLLPQRSHGQAALKALGENVDEAAAVNGMSTSRFKREVLDDPSLWVGSEGRLHYIEPAPAVAGTTSSEVQSAAAALEDTFLLHSREESDHVIYLDFGGITIPSNNFWVTNGAMSAQTVDGFSQDADPAFNDAEKTFIQQVWRVLSEKYAAFDVDVTTENPGSDGYNRSTGSDPTYGDRVIFSSDDDATVDVCNCPGTAFVGTFDNTGDDRSEPTWVFTDLLGGSATLAANAAAHEVGHTFGLSHDGPGSAQNPQYYSGHNHWVPLMGITNSKPVAQFSKGEYTNATNTEDDLAIIAEGGAPLVTPDDHGDTTGTATALTAGASSTSTGLIRHEDDQDVFSVSSCDNQLVATATGIGTGQTLDLKVTVYDENGALVGANDPASGNSGAVATGMNAAYTVAGPSADTYYIEIDGVGSGGLGNVPNPSTGYSDYASIGQYTLAITCDAGASAPSPPQDLVATPTLRSTNGSVQWSAPASGAPITGYTVTGLPGGTVNLSGSTTSVASTSLVPGTTYTVGVIASNANGDSSPATVTLRVPTWAPSAAPVVTPTVNGQDVGVTWGTVANPGGSTITGWAIVLKKGDTIVNGAALPVSPRSYSFDDLDPGAYTVTVTVSATADDTSGRTPGTANFTVADVPPVPTVPAAPKIGAPSFGTKGGAITAITRWAAPTSNGGSAITGYRAIAYKLTAAGNISKAYFSKVLPPSSQSYKWTTIPAGKYKFRVVAYNAVGTSPYSAFSSKVLAQ